MLEEDRGGGGSYRGLWDRGGIDSSDVVGVASSADVCLRIVLLPRIELGPEMFGIVYRCLTDRAETAALPDANSGIWAIKLDRRDMLEMLMVNTSQAIPSLRLSVELGRVRVVSVLSQVTADAGSVLMPLVDSIADSLIQRKRIDASFAHT